MKALFLSIASSIIRIFPTEQTIRIYKKAEGGRTVSGKLITNIGQNWLRLKKLHFDVKAKSPCRSLNVLQKLQENPRGRSKANGIYFIRDCTNHRLIDRLRFSQNKLECLFFY